MLTVKGVTWLTASAGLVLLGLALASTPAVLVGAALGLHVILAWTLLGRPNLDGTVELGRDEISEKETLALTATLVNGSRRSLVVRYRIELPGAFEDVTGNTTGSVALPGGGTETIEAQVTPLLHGPYEVGPMRVLIEDPAGLVTREIQVAPAARLLTFPRFEEIRDLPLGSRMVAPYIGAHEVQQPGDGFEFYALRQYETGDSIRNINWRASARTDDLIVNQRVKESFSVVNIVLDGRHWEAMGIREYAPWYQGARAAAAIANTFMKARDQVTFHLATDRFHTVKPQPPARQRKNILELIAGNRPHGEMSIGQKIAEMMPGLRSRSLFVLVSSLENEPRLHEALKALRVREVPVLVITPATQWPEDGGPEIQAIKRRREQALNAVTTAGARVIEWQPGQLLEVTLREVIHA